MRRPEEAAVVVRRQGAYLVLKRSPQRHGYWHLVAGALEWGEEAAAAAVRELREETGLEAEVRELQRFAYDLAGDPPEVRARFAAGTETVQVYAFLAEAPAGWEPVLDEEHETYRWCSAEDAVALLAYPEPRAAVLAAEALA
ncbi:MAG TPA: NUDIX domain-containing protein [Gaiellaceae bacterium]|jgi:8-oxo-dGTP pyrophosphatase MutT (NUDIX family)|nr:NUDIX domain-containing protein [Gaiellaceae bacterium]